MMTMNNIVTTILVFTVAFCAFLSIYTIQRPIHKVSKESGVPEEPSVKLIPATPVVEKKTESSVPDITVPVESKDMIIVGIFGESRGDEEKGEATNTTVFKKFLSIFKKKEANAVFFSGNLLSGIYKPVTKKGDSKSVSAAIDHAQLNAELQETAKLIHSHLGPKIPFFPVLGTHEVNLEGVVDSFREAFNLKLGEAFEQMTLGYTVSIGNTLFVLIPTDSLNANHTVDVSFSPAMLTWLEKVLLEGSKSHSYMIVIGHEPAFPTTSTVFTYPHAKEAPSNKKEREAFWKVLVDNHVLAYFCSHEHLFDRSNRHGVWQIISGGGGALLNPAEGDSPFYHCLLLKVPQDVHGIPKLQLLNEKGEVSEEFEMSAQQGVFQQRISKSCEKSNRRFYFSQL